MRRSGTPARWSLGVIGLIMDGIKPARVADQVIDDLRKRERNGLIELPKHSELRPGDRVRVLHGPFAGQLGLYAGVRAHERVLVLLALLGGQQRVELTKDAIEGGLISPPGTPSPPLKIMERLADVEEWRAKQKDPGDLHPSRVWTKYQRVKKHSAAPTGAVVVFRPGAGRAPSQPLPARRRHRCWGIGAHSGPPLARRCYHRYCRCSFTTLAGFLPMRWSM